jgi:metallo-beta-lactamase family protein
MKLIIHRGDKEIGASCIEIRSDSGASIFIDAGLELYGEKATMPKEIENTDAIFLSHAHPDHFGLLGEVPQNIPMYCGEITESILQIMIAFNGDKYEKIEKSFLHFKNGEEVKIKDISVTPFLTDHSVPDSYAFLVKADGQSVFYSGDFRTGGRKHNCIEHILNAVKSPNILIADCTCIEGRKEGIKTEEELEEKIVNLISANLNLPVFAICSAINVDRIVTLYKAARRNKRVFVCDIYTALILWAMGKSGAKVPQITWDYVKVLSRGDIAKSQRVLLELFFKKLGFQDFRDIIYRKNASITAEEISKSPHKYLLKLNRVRDVQKACGIKKFVLIYSMWSGYLSPEFNKFGHYKDLMDNPNVIFEILHTGGHSTREDLKKFINVMSPEYLLPFHTNSQEYIIAHKDELFGDFCCTQRLITEIYGSELKVP